MDNKVINRVLFLSSLRFDSVLVVYCNSRFKLLFYRIFTEKASNVYYPKKIINALFYCYDIIIFVCIIITFIVLLSNGYGK